MTDKEKAEEYFCEHCENSFEHDNGHCSNCSKWDYFIAGLAEGRKEKQTIIDSQTVAIESRDVYLAEKENIILRQQSEIEQLKKILETPMTRGRKTTRKDYAQTIWNLSVERQNLEKDKEQIIFETDLKIKALEDHIEKLEAESLSKDECIDNLQHDLKDVGGELELWQRENAELKRDKTELVNSVTELKSKITELEKYNEKMKRCENCKWYKDNDCIGDIVCTDNDWNGWELAE